MPGALAREVYRARSIPFQREQMPVASCLFFAHDGHGSTWRMTAVSPPARRHTASPRI